MSQHFFKCLHQGKPVCVLMGWDRPLSGFFLVVEADIPTLDDDYVYSNLNDPALTECYGLPDDIGYFKTVGKTICQKHQSQQRHSQIQTNAVAGQSLKTYRFSYFNVEKGV